MSISYFLEIIISQIDKNTIALTISILSFLVSFLSFLVSLTTLYRQRKRLVVTWKENLYVLNPETNIFVNNISLKTIYPVNSKVAFYGTVDIVNPSNMNMSYFDLRAFNPKNNLNHFIATMRTLPLKTNDIYISAFNDTSSLTNFYAKIPERIFGSLPAGSYTSIDILIFANNYVDLNDGIMLSVQTSNTSILDLLRRKNIFSVTNRKIFKSYQKYYNVSGYKDVLQKNSQNIQKNSQNRYKDHNNTKEQ